MGNSLFPTRSWKGKVTTPHHYFWLMNLFIYCFQLTKEQSAEKIKNLLSHKVCTKLVIKTKIFANTRLLTRKKNVYHSKITFISSHHNVILIIQNISLFLIVYSSRKYPYLTVYIGIQNVNISASTLYNVIIKANKTAKIVILNILMSPYWT